MKVIVIGLGSMGKRRIRLVKQIDPDIGIIGVDSMPERRAEASELYGITTEDSLNNAINLKAQCALVCTSPLSHSKIINQCLKSGLHVFTELNLVSDLYEENIAIADEKKLSLFLSSTFLYRAEVEYIKSRVCNTKSPKNYIYHIGQYLPDWHPWENYKNYFVGDKRTNGCREIFAIELPWLTDIFGEITDAIVRKGKNSELNIDYEDNYMLLVEHKDGTKGMLAVDVVSRKAARNFELFGEDLYLTWNGSPDGLYEYDYEIKTNNSVVLYDNVDKVEGYSPLIIENAYQNEIRAFFDSVINNTPPKYDFKKDLKNLEMIDKFEN